MPCGLVGEVPHGDASGAPSRCGIEPCGSDGLGTKTHRLIERALAVFLLLVAQIASPGPLSAQVHRVSNPVDSYLWWTLSEEISPEELKALYSDPALSLARYMQAVEAELEEPLSDEQLGRMTFYVNHQLTPELAPMWWAFDIFARDQLVPPGIPESFFVDGLGEYGISESGIDKILVVAHGCCADHCALMADLGPKQIEAQRLLADRFRDEKVGKAAGRPIIDDVNERRYDVVASVTGREAQEIQELVDALADWEAGSRLVAACLPALKNQLSDDDWQLFRSYLREQVIASLDSLTFFEEVVRRKGP